jgi:dinuclear metal center YbgI/SA1388 family protein
MKIGDLIAYLDNYLNIAEIKDYGPQGLQVEAEKENVRRLALAVDVAPPIVEAAAAWKADMLLVHHGLFWRDVQPLSGPLGRRIRLLLQHSIHLYAAHLCLDAHSEVGNNAVLARLFDIAVAEWWCAPMGTPIGILGTAAPGTTIAELAEQIEERLNTRVRLLAYGPPVVEKVAIVSGFGADEVGNAWELGADTFITGETSHANYWAAADHRLNVIYAGHYATETVGVQALGQHLADKFGLEVKFLDFPTEM